MPFVEFLQLVKVVKMLYGREQAVDLFQKNYRKYYNLNEMFVASLDYEDIPLQKPKALIH